MLPKSDWNSGHLQIRALARLHPSLVQQARVDGKVVIVQVRLELPRRNRIYSVHVPPQMDHDRNWPSHLLVCHRPSLEMLQLSHTVKPQAQMELVVLALAG